MEREVHRLERLITDKENTIRQLTQTNKELQKSLNTANRQIQILKQKAMVTFSYQNVPDRQIIKTLQAKLATSAWQMLQLQKTNKRYQQNIIKLQTQLLTKQQQLTLKKFQISETAINSNVMIDNQSEVQKILEQWEITLKEKQNLVEENFKLKEEVKSKEAEIAERIGFYLAEVYNLGNKIKSQHQQEKQRLSQFQNIVKQIKKQNQDLRQTIKKKNQQILLFYEQSKMISTTKAADLHTIRNLRAQIKKKADKYFKILSKLQQTEQLKNILASYNKECSQYMGQFNRLSQNLQSSRRQNGILKQKLKIQQNKVANSQTLIEQTNKKLYQLLIENEACHELLYQARSFSKLFLKDIEAKVEKFLKGLQKRRENCQSWLDVTELIAVNQKLRSKPIQEYN